MHAFAPLALICALACAGLSAADGNPLKDYVFPDKQVHDLSTYSGNTVAVWGLCNSWGDFTKANFATIRQVVDRRNAESRSITLIILVNTAAAELFRGAMKDIGVEEDPKTGVVLATTELDGGPLRRQSKVYGTDGQVADLRMRDFATLPADKMPK